jgi:membrane-associated phospholipid phosphatase
MLNQYNHMKGWMLVLLFLAAVFRMQAGSNDTIQYPELHKAYLKSYWYDSKSFVLSPAEWHAKQWIAFGIVAGAGVLAYTQDEKIQKYFVGHQSETADNLSKYIFEPFGNGIGTSVIIGGLYIGGRLAKDKRLAGTSLTACKAFLVSTTVAMITKQLTHRHRPYQDEIPDHTNWDGPFSSIEYNSFPSGHSTAAFSLATVFAMEYSSTIWVPVLAYTLATGTAVSRLYDNKHWASDVVIGSALGFVTGRFMWRQSRKGNNRVTILPAASTKSVSVKFFIRLAEPKHAPTCL